MRYIHKGDVREKAIGLIELKDMDEDTISEKLIKLLQPFEPDPLKCVGQGYDGATLETLTCCKRVETTRTFVLVVDTAKVCSTRYCRVICFWRVVC